MKDVKRIGIPILIGFVSALLTRLLDQYVHSTYIFTIIKVLQVVTLFIFGISLNKNRKKRGNTTLRKVVAVTIVVLLLFMQLGYYEIPLLDDAFAFLGINEVYLHMIYIFCGYVSWSKE